MRVLAKIVIIVGGIIAVVLLMQFFARVFSGSQPGIISLIVSLALAMAIVLWAAGRIEKWIDRRRGP